MVSVAAGSAAVADAEGEALEVVGGLDEALVGAHGQPEGLPDGRGGLLGALEGRGDDGGDVPPLLLQRRGDDAGHLLAAVGQAVPREAAI